MILAIRAFRATTRAFNAVIRVLSSAIEFGLPDPPTVTAIVAVETEAVKPFVPAVVPVAAPAAAPN